MTASSSLSNDAWAERQRDLRNRDEIIGLPIFTTLNPLYQTWPSNPGLLFSNAHAVFTHSIPK